MVVQLRAARAVHVSCSPVWRRPLVKRSIRPSTMAADVRRSSSAQVTTTDPSMLWRRIVERYDAAQRQQASSTFDTRTDSVCNSASGVTFVLKVATQLRDKPKPPTTSPTPNAQTSGFKNPFLPPDPELFVCHVSDSHSLVLNKFNVMPYHLLVITRAFESQLQPLNAADLAATCIAMRALPTGALAFYNCGPLSGASQPHKHVQVVPLPLNGRLDTDSGGSSTSSSDAPFGQLISAATASAAPLEPVELRSLPFVSFVARLPSDHTPPSPKQLEELFAKLLLRARTESAARGQPPERFSYNALLTTKFAMLVPRSAEGVGPVSCNSVAYAGSFFVRSMEELEFVQRDPLAILTAAGFSWERT